MIKKNQKGSLLLAALLSLGLLFSACVGTASQTTQQPQAVNPTVMITRLVTQIVATTTITPTPAPTEVVSVLAPVSLDEWDPFAVPIYYPIAGCVASRLHVEDVAVVATGGGLIGLHMSKDIGDAPISRYLDTGEILDILKGPWCTRQAIVWKVGTEAGEEGFVAEGDGSTYYLLPMPPGTSTVYPEDNLRLQELINEWGQLNFGKKDK